MFKIYVWGEDDSLIIEKVLIMYEILIDMYYFLFMYFRGVLKWLDGKMYFGMFRNGLEDG